MHYANTSSASTFKNSITAISYHDRFKKKKKKGTKSLRWKKTNIAVSINVIEKKFLGSATSKQHAAFQNTWYKNQLSFRLS